MTRWQHVKRGTTYEEIGQARVQSDHPIKEGDLVVVYRAEIAGVLWVRPYDEFHDGRFKKIPARKPGGIGVKSTKGRATRREAEDEADEFIAAHPHYQVIRRDVWKKKDGWHHDILMSLKGDRA